MPFQRFPSAERASEFPCICDATAENTRKPDNTENTRARPTFDSRAFFAISCSALRNVAFSRNLQILRLRIYEYIYRVRYVETVSRRELWKVRELDFSKIFLAVAEFCTCVENIDLNLYRIEFSEIESLPLNSFAAEFSNFQYYITQLMQLQQYINNQKNLIKNQIKKITSIIGNMYYKA